MTLHARSWGDIYRSFSPRDVVFSGWVGDQDPTFDGLKNALMNIFHSAWRNYVNFGSDIGTDGHSFIPAIIEQLSDELVRCVRACVHAVCVCVCVTGGFRAHGPPPFGRTKELFLRYITCTRLCLISTSPLAHHSLTASWVVP
jgi:hypothetical protein